MELSRTQTRLNRSIIRHANDAPTRLGLLRVSRTSIISRSDTVPPEMNRSGNGQDRQPQKVSRSADDVRFIKPSEKLAQAIGSAQVYRAMDELQQPPP
jgi:hypothetical protein